MTMTTNQNIRINHEQCVKIGRELDRLNIRLEFYKREFLSFEADRETKLRTYFIAVAICHQTRNLVHREKNLFGWDYIEYAFLQMYKHNHPLLNPGYLSICSLDDIGNFLAEAFSPDGKPENTTLDRIEERTGMLLEICSFVKENFHGSISRLVDSCDGRLLNDGKGLYEVLSKLQAYSDPQKKKITFFLKLATEAGLMRLKDPQNAVPIMDYHMQRVLLRFGCVETKDRKLLSDLMARKPLASDEEIRAACIGAMRIIADNCRHELLKMNDFFWTLGRSCCNETTLCTAGFCAKHPCTFFTLVDIPSHNQCAFQDSCKGFTDENYRNLWEPMVQTHYY